MSDLPPGHETSETLLRKGFRTLTILVALLIVTLICATQTVAGLLWWIARAVEELSR
jgi:hypothetical protein